MFEPTRFHIFISENLQLKFMLSKPKIENQPYFFFSLEDILDQKRVFNILPNKLESYKTSELVHFHKRIGPGIELILKGSMRINENNVNIGTTAQEKNTTFYTDDKCMFGYLNHSKIVSIQSINKTPKTSLYEKSNNRVHN